MMEQETQDHLETGTPRTIFGVIANLLALVLLIASATLIADFTHRLLAADVDKVGLLSVALQIATAVVASSAFTKRGTALIDGLFTTKKGRRTRTFIRLALAVGTFALTLACWIYLPPRLAQHYYNEGLGAYVQSQTTGTDTIQAILFNERAIALDPTQQGFYVLQGTLMEGLYRYDAAGADEGTGYLLQQFWVIRIVFVRQASWRVPTGASPTEPGDGIPNAAPFPLPTGWRRP